jgi:hypothetical protein
MGVAEHIRSLVEHQDWEGTMTELAAALGADSADPLPATHLAIWLRRKEPVLWWDYGVNVRFTRNGRRRLVHLSRRERTARRSNLDSGDSKCEQSVVTAENC